MHIVLVDPEIPQNTGNIARTCASTGTELILCGKLGFSLEDKYLRRAGMDYLRGVDMKVFPDLDTLIAERAVTRFRLATKKARTRYDRVAYAGDEYLVFGCESRGLDEDLIRKHWDKCVRIPMNGGFRSLNLAVAAAVILYEALRQSDFASLCDDVGRNGKNVFG